MKKLRNDIQEDIDSIALDLTAQTRINCTANELPEIIDIMFFTFVFDDEFMLVYDLNKHDFSWQFKGAQTWQKLATAGTVANRMYLDDFKKDHLLEPLKKAQKYNQLIKSEI